MQNDIKKTGIIYEAGAANLHAESPYQLEMRTPTVYGV